jgi:hypothetical protein
VNRSDRDRREIAEALIPRDRSVTVTITNQLPDLTRQEMPDDRAQTHTPPPVGTTGMGRREQLIAETP